MASGNGQSVTVNGSDTLLVDGTGADQKLVDTTGTNIFELGHASSETVKVGGGNNSIAINLGTGQTTIAGMTSTDGIRFSDTQADATITKADGHTTVSFLDGQSVTFNGTHEAVYFSGDPAVHYI
jgi:hypothetical protein